MTGSPFQRAYTWLEPDEGKLSCPVLRGGRSGNASSLPDYEKDVGNKDVIRACCWAHARRRFIDALKVQTKGHVADSKVERVVALMDGLFAIDREAREQNLSLEDRHALRQERAPASLDELKALLLEMLASRAYLKKSVAGQAIAYTLKRWEKLTHFLEHPVIELSTNWAENSMRPIAMGCSLCPSF
jgi:hypothetical protein